jgi:hypothetical protein
VTDSTSYHRIVFSFLATVAVTTASIAQDAKVRPGTPLAKLVAEASSHSENLAAAAAAPPKIDIPAWLRAQYRRNHSEMTLVAARGDPTGGYPLALESLYVWMLRNQDNLQPTPTEPVRSAAAPSVGPNRRISGASVNPRSESDIRINLNNPQQIIAGSNNIGNRGEGQAQFFSSDGGTSWGQTTLPLLSADSLHSDPTVAWTSDGTAWATAIGLNASNTVLQMRAYKSSDGGQSWTFDGTFSGNQTSADKQMMWVDLAPTSPFRDRIYVIWHNSLPAFMSYRSSAGWQAPVRLSGAETTGTAIGSDITTNAAGHVFAAWPDTGSKGLFFVKSTDGGNTFTSPRLISRTFASFQVAVPAFASRSALVGISIGAFQDNAYVAWLDLSGENGCQAPANEPAEDTNSDCKSRIWFSTSSDGGLTWSTPSQINRDGSRSDQFNHRLAVDPETGNLGIVYYNSGTGPDRKKTHLMFQFSTDKGRTWREPIRITTAMTDETTVDADNGNQYGDYNGLSVAKGVFFPSWTDRRNNGSEEIFTAKITLTESSPGVFRAVVADVAPP